jgi:hypothetical protein
LGGKGVQCDSDEQQVRQERRDGLRRRIAEIDADLAGTSGRQVTDAQADELKIARARLSYELAMLQPATFDQAETIRDPAAAQRRKQRDWENFVNLPSGLQQEMQTMGVTAPEKPPVLWVGGAMPSVELQAYVERIARTADADNISLRAAVRKVQSQGSKTPKAAATNAPRTGRDELNMQLVAG